MCYICWVRFLCSVYGLVHHCSARHPRPLGPWRDVVLAPPSITSCWPEPGARCKGGGMCCSGRTPSLRSTTHSLPSPLLCPHDSVANTQSFVIWMVRSEHVFCIQGLRPCISTVECSVLLITRDHWVIILQVIGETLAPLPRAVIRGSKRFRHEVFDFIWNVYKNQSVLPRKRAS